MKKNIYRTLRESTETDAKPALTQSELAAIFKEEGNVLSQSVISKLENQQKEPPTKSLDVIKAYATHFNVTADYLLGIRDNATVDENLAMIGQVTGLSDEAIQILKEWNELKKKPIDIIAGYGGTDIDALNLLLEDCYYRSKNAEKKGDIADWSIFHHIYNYFFSENLKKHPHNIVNYTHKFESKNGMRSKLKKDDVIISDGIERTVEKIETYDKKGFESTSDNFSIYNEKKQNEVYAVNFHRVMDSYTKDNIMEILKQIKNHIKERK